MSNMPNLQQSKMSEQDMLNDILSTEKQLMDSLNMTITESSCTNMRQMVSNIYNQTAQDQYQAFDCMRKRGWYQTKDAPDADVQAAKQAMNQLRSQLNV